MNRIVLVSGSFLPREGGAERQMRLVLAGLAGSGHRTHVVTQRIKGAPPFEVVDSIEVHRVGSLMAFDLNSRLGMVAFLIAAIVKTLRLAPTHLVSLQMGSASFAAGIVSRVRGVSHIVRLTGGGSAHFRSEAFARKASTFGRLFTKLLIDRPRTVLVAPARHLLEDFAECFPSMRATQLVVPNGVELASAAGDEVTRQGVLWYARRGSERSVSTFRNLADECPDVMFKVIGTTIENLGPNVSSLGWVNQPMDVMWGSRVLLNTSQFEGSPNTVLQALAAGCRVVAQDNRGMREIQSNYPDAVRLYRPDNIREAVRLLRSALDEPSPRPAAVVSAAQARRLWEELIAGGRK